MPNWKKLIVSGSDANLNALNVTTSITGSDVKIDDWGSVSGSLSTLTQNQTLNSGGTVDYVARFESADTISTGIIRDDGSTVGIGGAPGAKTLTVNGSFQATGEAFFSHLDIIGSGANSRIRDNVQLKFGTNRIFGIQYKSSGDYLEFTSGSDNLVTLDGDGKVGIGTTSPLDKLDVHGDIRASYDASNYLTIEPLSNGNAYFKASGGSIHLAQSAKNNQIFLYDYTGGTARWGEYDASSINLKTSTNTSGIFLNTDGNSYINTGNVGIGTTSPGEKLDVAGNIIASGTGSFESITIPGNTTDYYIGGSGGGAATGTLRIGSRTTANTIAMELFHATNPVSLGVSYSGGDALAFIDSVHSSFDSVLQFKTGGSERFRIGAKNATIFEIKPATSGNDIQISDNSGNAILYSDTNTQNIGIGTTSASEKLTVEGDISGSGDLHIGAASTGHIRTSGNNSLRLYPGGSGHLYLGDAGNGMRMYHYSDVTGGQYTTYSWSGNYYTIGTNATNGIKFTNDTRLEGDLVVTGTVTAQEFHTEFVSASIIYESGSTKFGDTSDDIHSFSGSLRITGSGDHYFTDGNVGIGTTSPSGPLHVYNGTSERLLISGDVAIKGATDLQIDGTSRRVSFNAGTGTVRTSTANSLFLATDNTTAVTINSAQSIQFDSYGLGNKTGTLAYTLGVDSSGNVIEFTGGSGGGTVSAITSGADTRVAYFNGNDSLEGSSNFTWDDNKLTINKSTIGEYLRVGSGAIRELKFSTFNTTSNHAGHKIDASSSNGEVQIATGGTSRLTIKPSGNVGIGTTDPYLKLHVNGNARVQGNLMAGNASASNTPSAALHIKSSGTDAKIRIEDSDSTNQYWDLLVDQGNGLYFNEDTDTRVTFKEGGNVGIGTTTPSQKLDVEGSVRVAGNIYQPNYSFHEIKVGNTNAYLWGNHNYTGSVGGFADDVVLSTNWHGVDNNANNFAATNNFLGNAALALGRNHFRFFGARSGSVAPSELMRLDIDTGRLGLGDTSPTEMLSIATDTDVSAEIGRAHVGFVGFSDYAGFSHIDRNATTDYALLQSSGGETFLNAASGQAIKFRINNSDKMYLSSAGNVGIGTTSPSAKLDVAGGAEFNGETYIRAQSNVGLRVQTIDQGLTSSDGLRVGLNATHAFVWNYENTPLSFGTNGSQKATILANGNIGIGTSNPTYKLDVTGNIRVDSTTVAQMYLDSAADNDAVLNFHEDGSQKGKIGYDTSLAGFALVAGSGAFSTADLVILDNGNVGIGTTSPARKLDVNGEIQNNGIFRKGGNVIIKSTGSETMFGPGGSGIITFHNSATMTTADETVRIDADGNLLLNNTSAGARLDIREDTNYAIRAEDASGHYFRVNTGGDVDMRGNLTVEGTVTAQEFHTEFVSASIIYDSGSTKFGDTLDDTHSFTGSLEVSGSGIFNTHIGNPTSPYSGDDQFIKLTNSNNATGTLVNADNGNTWLNADGGKDLWLNWYSLNSPSSKADLQVGDGNGGSAIVSVVGSSKRVGIGTTGPSSKLHIKDAGEILRLQGNTGQSYMTFFQGTGGRVGYLGTSGASGIILESAAQLSLYSGGSATMYLDTNSNVGIGTTSPSTKLHISSSAFNDHITLGRASDELGISVSGGQILVEGGLSPFNNDSEDLGRSDKHWQDLYITDNIYVSQSATLTLNGELDVTGLISGSDINIDDWGSVSASLASIQTEGVDGSGTANYITKWSDSDTVTSSGMFQAASGNFSIGITTPNAKLSVVNDISIGTSATDVLRLHNESGVGTIDGYSTRSIAFGSATNGEVMRIDNTNGRIGIGTTTPNAKLHISSSGAALEFERDGQETYQITHGTSGLYFTRPDSSALAFGVTQNSDFDIFDTSANVMFRADASSGNVGIGTTSPAYKLDVSGDIRSTSQVRANTNLVAGGYIDVTGIINHRDDIRVLNKLATNWITWATRDTSGSDSVINLSNIKNITASGNVGIGTTSPNAKLDVRTVDGNGTSFRVGRADNSSYWDFNHAGNDLRIYNSDGSGSDILLGLNASGTDQGNRVGIGTATPSYRLDVESSANIIAEFVSTTNKGAIKISDDDTTAYISAENSRIGFGTSPQLSTNNITILTTNNNVGIGTTTPDAKLDIEGDLQVKGINISNQENLDIDTGTETIATVVKANYDAAFFDYVIKKDTNLRAGTVMAVHDDTNVEFTDNSTKDLGDTSGVTFTVDISGTDLRLRATTTSDNWIIKTLVRSI